MGNYLVLWELNNSLAPIDAKERGALWLAMTETVKQDLAEGRDSDWGCFVGETKGYSIGTQSEKDLAKTLQQFYPYVTFEVHQVLTVDEMAEVIKSLAE